MCRVLVIDDDTEFCELVADCLEPEGMEVNPVHDGKEGLRRALADAGKHDLILLDLMLPGMNGLNVLRGIRSSLDTPVLMVTGSLEESHRIAGLEMGADDTMMKPFNPRELVARIRAILRRTRDRFPTGCPSPAPRQIQVGDIELDPGSRIARRNGQQIDLTSAEFGLLEMLLSSAGSVVTRNQLVENVLGRSLNACDRSLDVHVSSLRRKLGRKNGSTDRIKTVRGIGYMYSQPWTP